MPTNYNQDYSRRSPFTQINLVGHLTGEQKKKRFAICQENLKQFKEDKWRLCNVVTGDESFIYHRKIEKKAINASWVNEGESPKTRVRRGRFEPKTMICVFFKTTGPVLIHCPEKHW